MAIEIIERGELPEDKQYDVTCTYCRSRLRFKRSDARYSSDQRDGYAMVIDCPVCSRQVWRAA